MDARMDARTETVMRADDEGGDDGKRKDRGRRSLEDRLLKTRTVTLFDPISPRSSKRVVTSLLVLDAEDSEAPITLLVNSPGGSVDDGFAIYDAMRFVKAPVRAVCVGLSASAANIVLLGAPKGSRYSLPNTRVLIHQPSTGVRGQASDIAITAEQILKTRKRLNDLLVEETGQSLERIEEDTNRDFWMSAAEAKEYGLVDTVIENRGDLD